MKFHVVANFGFGWQIHKHNCRDVPKKNRAGGYTTVIEAESPEALIKTELADDLAVSGYTEADFKIMPCVKQ